MAGVSPQHEAAQEVKLRFSALQRKGDTWRGGAEQPRSVTGAALEGDYGIQVSLHFQNTQWAVLLCRHAFLLWHTALLHVSTIWQARALPKPLSHCKLNYLRQSAPEIGIWPTYQHFLFLYTSCSILSSTPTLHVYVCLPHLCELSFLQAAFLLALLP